MPLSESEAPEPRVVWLSGLSGAGKTPLADALALRLRGVLVARLDGDDLRGGLCADLGFGANCGAENLRRGARVARLLSDAGQLVVGSSIAPRHEDRARVREIVGGRLVDVFVSASLEECERRGPKGLHRRARAGELLDFTGIFSPFEVPTRPDLEYAI